MYRHSAPRDLQAELKLRCERLRRPTHTILFKRGQSAFGMFIVLTGKVSLDFGVDGASSLNGAYGPGALVGLPASLIGRNYNMTATVTDDAELGFLSTQELKRMLREHPELCRELLEVLSAKISHTYQIRKGNPKAKDVGIA